MPPHVISPSALALPSEGCALDPDVTHDSSERARGPDPEEQALQRQRDRDKLDALDVSQPQYHALWDERRKMLGDGSTSARQASAAHDATPDVTGTSYWARLYQRVLMLPLHPATWYYTPHTARHFHADAIDAARREKTCVPVTIPTGDARATLLDGLLVHPKSAPCERQRPIIVLGVGFAMGYEMAFDKAQEVADAHDVTVLLFNDRGVGASLGTQYTTQQAVQDCKAALLFAKARAHHIGYYGISLASAVGLRAVQDLAEEGRMQEGDLGLFMSVRGFSSVARVVGGWPEGLCHYLSHPLTRVPVVGRALGTTASLFGAAFGALGQACATGLMDSAGLDSLDMVEALKHPVPADEVVITAADNDRLVMGQGQLGVALGFADETHVRLPSGQQALYVAHHGQFHTDRNMSHPLHDAALARWSARAHARQSTDEPHGDNDGPKPTLMALMQAQKQACAAVRA